MTGLTTKCMGQITAAGEMVSNVGIVSSTYVSTGRYRANFVDPYEPGEIYPAQATAHITNPSNRGYWGRVGAVTSSYVELVGQTGTANTTFGSANFPMSFECLHMTTSGTDAAFPLLAAGLMTGTGGTLSAVGVASTTYISTGEVRINYEDPTAVSQCGFSEGVLGVSSNSFWTNLSVLGTGYAQFSTTFGNTAVFNKTNPTIITFKVMKTS